MYVRGICKKCHKTGVVNIGNLAVEDAKDLLSKIEFGECPFGGFHVEIGKINDYILFDFDSCSETKEDATQKEYVPLQGELRYGKLLDIETKNDHILCSFMHCKPSAITGLTMTVLQDTNPIGISIKDIISINGETFESLIAPI